MFTHYKCRNNRLDLYERLSRTLAPLERDEWGSLFRRNARKQVPQNKWASPLLI
jgi:hypothetical protein